jgi:THO complex subunit 6
MLYNTVLAQTFSPCGNYLVAGNTYGEVVVYE